jgi:hypothetical protein
MTCVVAGYGHFAITKETHLTHILVGTALSVLAAMCAPGQSGRTGCYARSMETLTLAEARGRHGCQSQSQHTAALGNEAVLGVSQRGEGVVGVTRRAT